MAKTRSQEDDPVPQWLLRYEEATEQWLSRMEARFQEANDQWISRMEAMVADWRVPMKQKEQRSNQRSDDQSTLDRSSTPSMKTNLEEKSTSQFQVSIANSEIVRISEPGKVDLGFEKLEVEVDGDVERVQQMIRDTEDGCAHKVLVKMPSKEKHMKHLKAWKFKFKSTSKRSRSMDDKFSFVDATVLLNKEPQKTIWDCVKKEFKETMAACGKNRVDRFKLAEEKESRLQVLDLNQTFMYHQISHGVDIVLAFKMLGHDKEMVVVLQRSSSLTTRDCPDRSSRANQVWKPGLEIYGCVAKKQMLLSDKLANRVWERGKLLATHLYWELFGLRALIELDHISLNGMCNKLVNDEEKQELRHVGDDVKKGQNSFLGDVKSMSVQKRVLLQADETIIKTDLCQTHQLQDTTVSNWAPDSVKQLQQSENPNFQKVHETLWLTLSIPPTNQMKNVHTRTHMVQWDWQGVKHNTQQTDFHVWHRWKNKAGKLKASLVCSGKIWSFVVYAFDDHAVVLRKEPILSPKIKRGFELSYLPNLEVKVSLNGEDLI